MTYNYLPHYYNLLDQNDHAYYLLCKQIKLEWPEDADLEQLWEIHDHYATVFKSLIQKTASDKAMNTEKPNGGIESGGKLTKRNLLDLKIEIAGHMLSSCEFCENNCKVDRYSNSLGTCGISADAVVYSAFLHHGEESPLVPSGTIFFSGCTFGCVFCQNWDISSVGKDHNFERGKSRTSGGNPVDERDLAMLADRLVNNGAKNINYVGGDPTPNLHVIIHSLRYQNRNVCQLWNSNFYNTIPALKLLVNVMDFWLPDFKYGNNECGEKFSLVKNYWDILTRNLKYIYDWGSRDICIRHLVMPGHFKCCTKPILEWIASEIPGVVVNIMGQYRPEYKVNSTDFPEINRKVTREEMVTAFALADELGIEYRIVS